MTVNAPTNAIRKIVEAVKRIQQSQKRTATTIKMRLRGGGRSHTRSMNRLKVALASMPRRRHKQRGGSTEGNMNTEESSSGSKEMANALNDVV
jgi:hypothetical protein